MSNFNKTLNFYRAGDWKKNFKNINYTNAEQSLKSILTKEEYKKVYDRIGNHSGSTGQKARISYDETIFRILVLMDSQMSSRPNESIIVPIIKDGEVYEATVTNMRAVERE